MNNESGIFNGEYGSNAESAESEYGRSTYGYQQQRRGWGGGSRYGAKTRPTRTSQTVARSTAQQSRMAGSAASRAQPVRQYQQQRKPYSSYQAFRSQQPYAKTSSWSPGTTATSGWQQRSAYGMSPYSSAYRGWPGTQAR